MMVRREPKDDLRTVVQKMAEMNSAPPWQQVLLRYKAGALSQFLKRYPGRDQFREYHNSLHSNLIGKRRRQAFVALIEGLAHCSNELSTPLRNVAHEQATLRAQGKRVPGTGHYSAAADIDVRRKKSFAIPGIKKARSVLLLGYALIGNKKPLSIETWRTLRPLIVPLLALEDNSVKTEQQKDETCYAAIRSLLRTLDENKSVSDQSAKAAIRELIKLCC